MGKRVRLTQAQRYSILERDEFCCQECGRGGRFSDWRLEVHHKDKNPANNNPSNLVTLCVACHNKKHPFRHCCNIPLTFSELRKRNPG